jgi:hypothetical protein
MQRRRKKLNYGWANTVVIGSSENYPSRAKKIDVESIKAVILILSLRKKHKVILYTEKVASSRLVYYSIFGPFCPKGHSKEVSKFPFINSPKILGCATNRDSLLLVTLE